MLVRTLLASAAVAMTAVAAGVSEPTYYKDVLPILQNRCQGCHRPGEAAPMSFVTYKDTRPWAKAIREAVLVRKMPPWLADPHYGKFSNDASLRPAEIETLVAWADRGALEGNAQDAPRPLQFVEGWAIGQPDVVFEMPNEFSVPASGTIAYQYIVIPTGFTEDRWVQFGEARPGNRQVVHHIIAFVRPPGSTWMKDAKPGVPFVPARNQRPAAEGRSERRNANDDITGTELLVGFAPGLPPTMLRPGQAKLVKAGSDLVLQMHYTASGKAGADKSRIGLIFAKQPPKERIFTSNATNNKFVIPAGDPNYQVESSIEVQEDTKMIDLMPHMHLRGKDFEYRAVYPTGETQVLLRVPKYDFNWQLNYYPQEPIVLPKGTRIECTAHFDNSANNPANPDPTHEVKWGDQSWQEMMIGWFDVAIDVHQKPGDIFKTKKANSSDD
jgi:hypothetical protein